MIKFDDLIGGIVKVEVLLPDGRGRRSELEIKSTEDSDPMSVDEVAEMLKAMFFECLTVKDGETKQETIRVHCFRE